MARDLQARTRDFSIRVIKFVQSFPRSPAADVIGRQLMRSGTSVGANCREADKAETRRDFVHKIALASKECAEAQYWIELAEAADFGESKSREWLETESEEIISILVTIGKRAKRKSSQNSR